MSDRAPYVLNADAVDSPPPLFPSAEVLPGDVFSLSPLSLADDSVFAELFAASHGDSRKESVWDFLPYGPFADSHAMSDFYRRENENGDPQFYFVSHPQNGACGVSSYLRIAPNSHSIEIGHIWHAAEMQGGRAHTEASFLLMSRAFSLGYRRLEWKCNAQNMKSRRAALRLGLAFEGVFRQCTVSKNRNRDTAWFAILDRDWNVARANIREWLLRPGSFSLTEKNRSLVEWSLPAHRFWTPPGGDA